jgi:single-stranded DNA-binding protein
MDLNRITLIGRMGSELTTKTIGEGETAKQVVSFRFAVNSPFDDQATWLTVECWGGLADVVNKLSLKKGSRLYVDGKLVPDKETGGPRAWIVEEGEKAGMAQASFVVWADTIIALDKKESSEKQEEQHGEA